MNEKLKTIDEVLDIINADVNRLSGSHRTPNADTYLPGIKMAAWRINQYRDMITEGENHHE